MSGKRSILSKANVHPKCHKHTVKKDPSATQAGGFSFRQSNKDTHFSPSETASAPAHARLIPGRRQAEGALVRRWFDDLQCRILPVVAINPIGLNTHPREITCLPG